MLNKEYIFETLQKNRDKFKSDGILILGFW